MSVSDGSRPPHERLRAAAGPLGVAAALLLACVIVDPFREILTHDDGWAYARSVEHLLATGAYRLDAWSAANLPVQIYLAAGFSELFGYSLSLLRLTTLGLLAVGLASFHALLRDLAVARPLAAALTLGLLASPLVILLSFTFMSDVQFMGWLLLACWLYVRGFRRGEARLVLLGSIAAAAAIGTRQFGVALAGGLALAWLGSAPGARPSLRLMAIALALPGLAGILQVLSGLGEPNFTQAARLADQRAFLASPASDLVRDAAWRLAIIAQYVGLSLTPILPLVVALALRPAPRGRRRRLAALAAFAILAGGLVVAPLLLGSDLSAPRPAGTAWPWPALGLPWLLPLQLIHHPALARAVDLAGLATALALVWIACRAAASAIPHARPRFEILCLGLTGAGLVALHLIYVQLNDTYIVSLAPFALLFVGLAAQAAGPRRALSAACLALSGALALLMALWIRADHDEQEAAWRLSEDLLARGVAASDIATTLQWHEYHGAFDAWLAAGAPQVVLPRAPGSPGFDDFHDPFYAWVARQRRGAAYLVRARPAAGWCAIGSAAYRSASFTVRQVHVQVRAPDARCGKAVGAVLRSGAVSPARPALVHGGFTAAR